VYVIEPVPRRHQDRKRAASEEIGQSRSASGEIKPHILAGATSGKLTLLPADRMIRMAPTMLKNSKAWPPGRWTRVGEPSAKLWLDLGRDDRKRNWNVPCDLQQPIEKWTGRDRVVITPPQRCDSFCCPPAVELIDQIGPCRGFHQSTTRQLPHERIISSVLSNTNFLIPRQRYFWRSDHASDRDGGTLCPSGVDSD
jgi:hypothetical protein